MDKTSFGGYIREKRQGKGFTQKELADLLFLDVTTVSKWERGVTFPDITLIPVLCRVLGVSEHELIESSNDTESRAIQREAKTYRRLKNAVFWGFIVTYAAAVLTCFIVNLAVEGTLSWFWTVFLSCLAGFTFVPGVTRFCRAWKFPAYLASTFLSLTALFFYLSSRSGTCWCWAASAGVFLGYILLFFPIIAVRQKAFLSEARYRRANRWFLLLYAVLLLAGTVLLILAATPVASFDVGTAILIALYSFSILIAAGLVQLLPLGALVRTGIDCLLAGVYLGGMNSVLRILLHDDTVNYWHVDFTDWANAVNGNVAVIVVGTCAAAGLLFLIAGICCPKAARQQKI